MTAAINTKPPIGELRFVNKPREHDEFPVGSIVQTPTGEHAEVLGYRGWRRGHRIWLVCRYLKSAHKRNADVQILPELVKIIQGAEK